MVIPKGLYGMVNLPLRVRASTDGRRGSAGQTPTPSAASAGSGAGHGSASSTSAGGVHPAAGHPQGLPSLVLELAQALMAGGSRILQLRMKTAPGGAVLRALEELRPLVRRRPGVKLIVNDRLDVALAGGADGVHLGQSDLPLRVARALCPPGFLIGVSTHDEEQVEAALEGGADYIAFGPIYPTASKDNPDPVLGVARLRAVCAASPVPVVAIGGITLERLPEVVAAGAHAAAIIAAVNLSADPQNAASIVSRAFG